MTANAKIGLITRKGNNTSEGEEATLDNEKNLHYARKTEFIKINILFNEMIFRIYNHSFGR